MIAVHVVDDVVVVVVVFCWLCLAGGALVMMVVLWWLCLGDSGSVLVMMVLLWYAMVVVDGGARAGGSGVNKLKVAALMKARDLYFGAPLALELLVS